MKVAIVMGSKTDYEVVKKCEDLLKDFNVEVTTRVISAHRTPNVASEFTKSARANGYDLIIGAAGKAAHLPGVIASYTTLPVIGLPIKSSTLDGMDSLLSIVQMPKGIPVATVAINGAENAALLALEIMSLKYEELSKDLENYRGEMRRRVIEDDESLGGF
ncbi:MAG: 5-(carboxyamino)imidazole ribonucleotide mutase [Anaeromicrobium sp.]|jgi:5-(carboxyamino)imidazole ribonucleotide mutase|uniref:5-(carboxyamino)imidazole ribonucleotide mutase n=1 Tax=Anaeromicrobium sp. TaxID=1929132 RepID=UPI0025D67092|nr:5-(carboxyamino)imidazole ribonucleotide mutase [Anaeromicrobium sp.]MCT4593790.1 5-(carboxyamino)imidazole ribonucleotide mutase [Anaeromicrobium sp.]